MRRILPITNVIAGVSLLATFRWVNGQNILTNLLQNFDRELSVSDGPLWLLAGIAAVISLAIASYQYRQSGGSVSLFGTLLMPFSFDLVLVVVSHLLWR
ncbi:hypothetical protein OZX65_01080 [Leuconostocaceae bacterium ESL0723]|nr:hypothetical protein OZX65_01080 [Leuconostocaceae bacterium ESL0723]